MANKVYNSETHKYNNIPKSDSIGAYVLYENGSKQYFLDTAITDGLATTASAGSFAITSHPTGRGEIFSSSGSQWVSQTSPGGSTSIGGPISSATAGSALYVGTGAVLAEDNLQFFWDTSTKTLKLGNKNYSFSLAGWGGVSCLQVANRDTPQAISNNGQAYGIKIDYYTTSPSGFTQTSGIRVRANVAASGGTAVATGVESFVTNTGSVVATDFIQGCEGIAQAIESSDRVMGGHFLAGASSGGSGTSVRQLLAVSAVIPSFSQFSVTDAILFYGRVNTTNGPTTNVYGLKIDAISSTAVTNSYGIYIDNTFDLGTTSRYAFYSTSTSKSLFSGTVALAKGNDSPSASNLVITGNVFHVTGTTNITSISTTGVDAGTEVVLIFDGSVTVTNGNNLKLAGDFSATANDTLKLVFEGTNFYEVSRSINT